MSRHTVEARKGAGYKLEAGQRFKVINTHGHQVVDFWAISTEDPTEFMSMVHTRSTLTKLVPQTGDILYSNVRAPIVRFVEDTSPGVHDTVVAPCDLPRYHLIGVEGFHDSCSNNFMTVMKQYDISEYRQAPESFNLFMNIPWTEDGKLSFEPTVSKPGDYVVFEAIRPVLMVVSSCPQDILPINSGNPVEFDVEISD
ncbi:MAG TPA: urea carboxylase-associated family protein [Thermomicrobiales bacterium]|nr:urea carboxylase-associated family protein [Thermomicrobiales bacterium]